MNKIDFLVKLADVLDHGDVIKEDQDVSTIDEWDSLGILAVLELLSDIGIKVQPEKINGITNIRDLLEIIDSYEKD
jgi:acyl carrier protein